VTHNGEQSRQGGARVRIPPPCWFAAAIVAGTLLPGLRFRPGIPGVALGIAAIAACLLLGLPAIGWFRRTGQDPKPWTPSPELIVRGSYRYSRNPMYLGMTLAVLGIALLAGRQWMALLALCALAATHFTAVLPEERYLAEKFGAPYLEYKARVRRYL
jgi:protein-S-isoprenylcysteine O-methyltransferase Ste14